MPAKACVVEGCGKSTKGGGRGFCSAHHKRVLRYGDPTFVPQRHSKYRGADGERIACKVNGCIKPAKALDLCAMHYMRFSQHGDVNMRLREWGTYRIVLQNGYIGIWAPGHPTAADYGYALEHRYVMHEAGYDVAGMHVHHIDHDRTNNDLANLELMTPEEHFGLHGAERRKVSS